MANEGINVYRPQKVLMISSGGGHWVQLKRLLPALSGCQIVFVTDQKSYRAGMASARFYSVANATRWNKFRLIVQALKIFWIVLRERPTLVISTGAACGFLAFFFAKLLLRSRTIWVDSMANVKTLSLSGKLVKPFADLWLTQWAHLAEPNGPYYKGSVL